MKILTKKWYELIIFYFFGIFLSLFLIQDILFIFMKTKNIIIFEFFFPLRDN